MSRDAFLCASILFSEIAESLAGPSSQVRILAQMMKKILADRFYQLRARYAIPTPCTLSSWLGFLHNFKNLGLKDVQVINNNSDAHYTITDQPILSSVLLLQDIGVVVVFHSFSTLSEQFVPLKSPDLTMAASS